MPSFAGEFTVPGATQEVYELLMDPHRLAKCLPDLKRYEVQDQNHFTVTLRVGLGRVRGPMTMKLEIVEKRENSYARMTGGRHRAQQQGEHRRQFHTIGGSKWRHPGEMDRKCEVRRTSDPCSRGPS